MTAITADPELVANDPDHQLAVELAEIFTADSPYMADLSSLMSSGLVGQDVGVHPGPDGLSQHTTFTHFTEASAEEPDFVSFVFCSYHDGTEYTLSTGAELPPGIGVITGAGTAVREDGQWLLHRLRQLGHTTEPAGTPDPCPDRVQPPEGEA